MTTISIPWQSSCTVRFEQKLYNMTSMILNVECPHLPCQVGYPFKSHRFFMGKKRLISPAAWLEDSWQISFQKEQDLEKKKHRKTRTVNQGFQTFVQLVCNFCCQLFVATNYCCSLFSNHLTPSSTRPSFQSISLLRPHLLIESSMKGLADSFSHDSCTHVINQYSSPLLQDAVLDLVFLFLKGSRGNSNECATDSTVEGRTSTWNRTKIHSDHIKY